MKILRKKNCGFTIIEILVVLSIMAMLIGIAGKRLMPRNPLVDDDVLKIRDFIEKCVFECRTLSLSLFDKIKLQDKHGKDVEFFSHGVIRVKFLDPIDRGPHGMDVKGVFHIELGKRTTPYMTYENKVASGYEDKLRFYFPKLRKNFSDIEEGVFSKKTSKFINYDKDKMKSPIDINAGGSSIVEKEQIFGKNNWNTFFDGCFTISDRLYFDVNDEKVFLCWKVTFDNGEKWCFYVDDFCVCHSVKMK